MGKFKKGEFVQIIIDKGMDLATVAFFRVLAGFNPEEELEKCRKENTLRGDRDPKADLYPVHREPDKKYEKFISWLEEKGFIKKSSAGSYTLNIHLPRN